MADNTEQKPDADQPLPRVVADFGGRRKIFERRMKQIETGRKERRFKINRRSGFDRRGASIENDADIIEKRTDLKQDPDR